jgi:hypothetical protein
VRSARRHTAGVALLAACGLIVAEALGGCATTQDTAALKQAESKRILEARKDKHHKGSEKR